MKRLKLGSKNPSKNSRKASGGLYFTAPKSRNEFVRSGCTLLDLVLGGGYPCGKVVNIVGDNSTGKTQQATEACANFARQYPDGKIKYRDAEAAYDIPYGNAIGLPEDRVDFGDPENPLETIEEVFKELEQFIESVPKNGHGMYILDSLDALSDKAELAAEIDSNTYGMNKAKKLGQLFRRLVRKLRDKNVLVMIISQVREKINVMFGEKYFRTGGKSLDFYASQILWLQQMGKIKKEIGGIERKVGVNIRALAKKNKIGLPYRECQYPIVFSYGIDDLTACVEFLVKAKLHSYAGFANAKKAKAFLREVPSMDDAKLKRRAKQIRKATRKAWRTIEKQFMPARRKYE